MRLGSQVCVLRTFHLYDETNHLKIVIRRPRLERVIFSWLSSLATVYIPFDLGKGSHRFDRDKLPRTICQVCRPPLCTLQVPPNRNPFPCKPSPLRRLFPTWNKAPYFRHLPLAAFEGPLLRRASAPLPTLKQHSTDAIPNFGQHRHTILFYQQFTP